VGVEREEERRRRGEKTEASRGDLMPKEIAIEKAKRARRTALRDAVQPVRMPRMRRMPRAVSAMVAATAKGRIVELIGICIVDVEGDEENLTDEMGISSSVSAEVKGMIGRRPQRTEGGCCFKVWDQGSRHTCSVNLRGRLVDGEFGRFGRSSRWGFVREMVQDGSDDGGVDNEGEELHFFPASRTGQRVDLVDPANELGPSLARSASLRGSLLDALRLVYGGVVGSDGLGTDAVGVKPHRIGRDVCWARGCG
jgi:hypothetical protein